LQVQVTQLGNLNGDLLESITVQGLSSDNVQALGTISLIIGDNTYLVDQVIAQDDGQYTLVVLGGINASGVEVGSQVTVVVGNGGNSDPGSPPEEETPPPPDEPPPVIEPEDPTDSPAGG
jgi:hypothetical protein